MTDSMVTTVCVTAVGRASIAKRVGLCCYYKTYTTYIHVMLTQLDTSATAARLMVKLVQYLNLAILNACSVTAVLVVASTYLTIILHYFTFTSTLT